MPTRLGASLPWPMKSNRPAAIHSRPDFLEITMSPSPILLRTAAVSALAVAVLATSGCGWFRKENAPYAQAPENRPLEVPPDLDRPRATGALATPDQPASVTRSDMQAGAGAPAAGTGFAVAGDRDAVFAQVGEVLA